jgi:hypothetical protein
MVNRLVKNSLRLKSFIFKSVMTPLIFSIVTTLGLLAVTSNATAATLTASIDRKEITENDSFRLFLRYDEQVGFGQPDLTALKKEFRIINQQRANQFRSMNGKTVSYTEWTLALSPLKTGDLIIPSIEFNGQKSQEIKVSVNTLPDSVKEQIAKEFFFDIELDTKSTYVQGQVLYTEKLYYTVTHEEPTLSELKVTDALVIPLGEVRQYTTTISGQRMGVYERRYAIFAEESGEMVIPGQKFSANVVNSYNRWSRGRPVAVIAEPTRIKVKARPSTYPNTTWLPSNKLVIEDRWSKPNNEWQVGEPVTRTVVIKAHGLSGSQLPSITMPIVDGLKYYPDQSEYNDQSDNLGIQGSSQQSLAIVPTKSGRILIPEVRIPWWNLEKNKLEYAVLPAQTIQIAEPSQVSKTASSQSKPSAVESTDTTVVNQSGLWVITTLLLLITNMVTIFLLWRSNAPKEEDQIEIVKPGQHLKQLKKACQDNDAYRIRQHLKDWAQEEYQITNLDQLSQKFSDIALSNAINELDSYLYQGKNNSAFNGQILWNSLSQAIKKKYPSRKSDKQNLQPLYQ